MISLQKINAGYDAPVLHQVSANFEKGKLTGIIGRNGSGKSTLLKAVLGMVGYTGTIELDGADIKSISSRNRAQKTAFVFQSRTTPLCSVSQLVLHGRFCWLSAPRIYREADKESTSKTLEMFGLLPCKDRMLSELSGGQRQKVYLAMAFNQQADYLFLDEPLTYLDLPAQKELTACLMDIKKQNRGVIAVLHDLMLALEICDEILLLDNGRAVFQGPVCSALIREIEKIFEIQITCIELQGKRKYLTL